MSTEAQNKKPNSGEHVYYLMDLRRKRKREEWKIRIAEAWSNRLNRYKAILEIKLAYLSQYWDQIEETNNKAKNVINAIESNTNVVKRASANVELANDGVQYLVVSAEKAAIETEDLMSAIEELMSDLNGMSQPPSPDSPIMKAIDQLKVSVKVAMDKALEVLGQTLETYQRTEMLKEQVGNEDGDSGLTKSFNGLNETINIKYDPDSKIKFPRESCPEDYWDQTKAKYDVVAGKIQRIQERLNRIEDFKNLAIARKEAVEVSLVAAEKAAAC